MTDRMKSEPVHKIRAGTVGLAFWKNAGEVPSPSIDSYRLMTPGLP